MGNKCSKCGKTVYGDECVIFSGVMTGVKYLAVIGVYIGQTAKVLPNGGFVGSLVGNLFSGIAGAIPTSVVKYKCSCGHSWGNIIKEKG